jgi:hypothetical protein
MIPIRTLSLLAYFTYILIDIIMYALGSNLLDGGPSREGHLLGPFVSL